VYKLTEQEIIKLTSALHDPVILDRFNRPLVPAEERCKPVWKEIAAARNLKWETCGPAPGMAAEYFIAEEKEQENDEQL